MKRFASEKELARAVVRYLCPEGWEIYQEVNCGRGSPTCDIVATRGPVVWAIECKLVLNFEVIGQAMHWRHRAHFQSVATPFRRERTAFEILRQLGIGWIKADPSEVCKDTMGAFTRVRNDRFSPGLARFLCEEQKTAVEAGGNRGGYHSPFKATCDKVRRAVEAEPGITLKSLIGAINGHHYSSDAAFKGCISKWAEMGSIKGVQLVRDGRSIKLFPSSFSDAVQPSLL